MAFVLVPRISSPRHPLRAPPVLDARPSPRPPSLHLREVGALAPEATPERAARSALELEHVQGRRRVWLGVTSSVLADGASEVLSFDWRQIPGVVEVGHPRWALVRLHAAVRGSVMSPHLEVDSAAAEGVNLAVDVLLVGLDALELVTPLPGNWGGVFALTVTNRSGGAAQHRVCAALERWDDVCR